MGRPQRRLWDGVPISMALFGKDHWSTFAYIETRIVDHDGILDPRHMRGYLPEWQKFPTRLRGPRGGLILLFGHSDYDCTNDAVTAGLLVPDGAHEGSARYAHNRGSNREPQYLLTHRYDLTDRGREVAGLLRGHKGQGGVFHHFGPVLRASA